MIYAVGDIHGCSNMLLALLRLIKNHGLERGVERPRIVLLGDYIDRGPSSRIVLTLLCSRELMSNFDLIPLLGNHDQYLLYLKDQPDDVAKIESWFRNGGRDTVASYGFDPILLRNSVRPFVAEVPVEHYTWLGATRLTYEEGAIFFVHAGIDPNQPISNQSKSALVEIREPFLTSKMDFGIRVVHGHSDTIDCKVDIRPNRVNVNTGAGKVGGVLSAVAIEDDGTIETLSVGPAQSPHIDIASRDTEFRACLL